MRKWNFQMNVITMYFRFVKYYTGLTCNSHASTRSPCITFFGRDSDTTLMNEYACLMEYTEAMGLCSTHVFIWLLTLQHNSFSTWKAHTTKQSLVSKLIFKRKTYLPQRFLNKTLINNLKGDAFQILYNLDNKCYALMYGYT